MVKMEALLPSQFFRLAARACMADQSFRLFTLGALENLKCRSLDCSVVFARQTEAGMGRGSQPATAGCVQLPDWSVWLGKERTRAWACPWQVRDRGPASIGRVCEGYPRGACEGKRGRFT